MREKFQKIILADGTCVLAIVTPRNHDQSTCGWDLMPDGVSLQESEITRTLLHMLAEAYYAGYQEAVDDGIDVVSRLLFESKKDRKPAAKISMVYDHRPKSDK